MHLESCRTETRLAFKPADHALQRSGAGMGIVVEEYQESAAGHVRSVRPCRAAAIAWQADQSIDAVYYGCRSPIGGVIVHNDGLEFSAVEPAIVQPVESVLKDRATIARGQNDTDDGPLRAHGAIHPFGELSTWARLGDETTYP